MFSCKLAGIAARLQIRMNDGFPASKTILKRSGNIVEAHRALQSVSFVPFYELYWIYDYRC